MIQTLTQNDMIKAIYHELPANEMAELEDQLESNEEAKTDFDSFRIVKLKLDDLVMEPSNKVVAAILNYSKSYNK